MAAERLSQSGEPGEETRSVDRSKDMREGAFKGLETFGGGIE
jgi:hypothetical protein